MPKGGPNTLPKHIQIHNKNIRSKENKHKQNGMFPGQWGTNSIWDPLLRDFSWVKYKHETSCVLPALSTFLYWRAESQFSAFLMVSSICRHFAMS